MIRSAVEIGVSISNGTNQKRTLFELSGVSHVRRPPTHISRRRVKILRRVPRHIQHIHERGGGSVAVLRAPNKGEQ